MRKFRGPGIYYTGGPVPPAPDYPTHPLAPVPIPPAPGPIVIRALKFNLNTNSQYTSLVGL